jgi:hypothetical protein
MNKLLAYWRVFRGYCPACNFDAPKSYTCQVCHDWHGNFPPENVIAASWLMLYFDQAPEARGCEHVGLLREPDKRVTVSARYLQNLINRAFAKRHA